MIFARDKSQMCNNLLQYAHVYAWGREHGRKVISMRFSYKYQYFHICHTNLTGFAWYLFAKYMAALKLLPTASFKYSDCDREALERKMLRYKHIVVSGWNVRFYDLFLKYRQEICQLFTLDSQYTEPVRKKLEQIKATTSYVWVYTSAVETILNGLMGNTISKMKSMAAISTGLQRCILTRRFMFSCLPTIQVYQMTHFRKHVLK